MAEVATPKAPKAKREPYQEIFPTEDAAVVEANKREKGPRRAFKVTQGNKTMFVVANNEGRAGGVFFHANGGVTDEIGKAKRAPKALSLDGLMSAVNALADEDRKKVLEQLKALAAHKAK